MREKLLEKANKLPMLPGVYIMLNATGQVIYVGKAKTVSYTHLTLPTKLEV